MATNCTAQADERFGPVVDADCRDGFDFTLVFEQAIFGLVPSAIFLLAFPVRFVYLAKRDVRARSGLARVVKVSVALIFACLQLVLLVQWSLNEDFDSKVTIASAATNLIVALQLVALSWIEDSRSVRPSTLLSLYLFFTVLLDLPQVRTLWLQHDFTAIATLFTCSLAAKGLLLILEILEKRHYLLPNYRHLSPETISGIIGRSFLWWLNGIFQSGFRKLLEFDDLYVLDDDLASAPLETKMQRAWTRRKQPERRLEFPISVCRALKWPLLSIMLPRLLLVGFTFSQPFLFQRLLTLLAEPINQATINAGYGLIGATVLIYLGLAVLKLHYAQQINRLKAMFRGAAVTLIYGRALTVQDGLYDESAAITLMSTDVDRISEALTELNEVWARTLEVALGIFLLANQLGWVSVMPVLLSVVCFFGARQIAKNIGGQQKAWVDAVQKRIAMTGSLLAGMRSIRMIGLSRLLTTTIQDQRIHEVEKLKGFRWSIVWQNAVQNLPWALAPAFTFVVYAIQASVQGSGPVSTAKAFTSLSIITLLTDPVAKLLSTIPNLAASIGCVDRVQTFLIAPPKTDQRQPSEFVSVDGSLSQVSVDASAGGIELSNLARDGRSPIPSNNLAVVLDGVDARPVGASESILHDITFRIPRSSFTMVVGQVACGKSTLLKTILGETTRDRGSISVANRRIAYCSQLPWLPSTSIKSAICGPFNEHTDDIDHEWYRTVLHACALEHDMSLLSNGDSTRLGSGSTVLSGGQKQRVALARAVYSRAEIMLLDDVLSALDRKTQKNVVEALFGRAGLFRKLGSTVVLATHATEYLPYADKILVLDGGCIQHEGSYEQLTRAGMMAAIPSNENVHAEDDTAAPPKLDVEEKSTQAAEANEISDLTRQTGDSAVYKYYFKSIGWSKALSLIGFSAIHVFGVAFSYIWLKWWADGKIGQLGVFTAVYVFLGIINVAGIFGYAWSMLILITPSVARKLHYILLKTVMRAPQSFFSVTEAGTILNRFSQDMSLIETPLGTGVIITVTNLLGAAAEAALIATGSTYMAITIPFLIIAVYALQHVYLRTSRQLRLLDLETRSPLYSHFLESLDGLATIRAFGWESDAKRQNHRRLDVSQRPYYLMLCIQTWLELVLDLIVGAEAVTVVGLAMGLRSYTSAGLLGVSLNNILSFNGSLSSVVAGWTLLETSLGSIARVRSFEIEVKPEDRPEDKDEAPRGWPSRGSIELNNVTASHNPSAIALHNVSLHIRPGQKVGICGRTGSGKSSLIATILQLLEVDGGNITIDGVNLATLPRDTIRERIVTVPQDSPVLIGSVRLNVDPHGAHPDAAIINALSRVGLWTVLCERGGLDVEMTQSSLSQGQQQLLSLARAVLSEAKILLLDEPTSNVDAETDAVMQQVLRQQFADCTVLTVAHRINTIFPGSDVIVVVDEGRIAEVGLPDELLKTGGRFAELAGR